MSTREETRKEDNQRRKKRRTPEETTRNTVESYGTAGGTRSARPWSRADFMDDLHKVSARIAAEIEANPEETARMERSQRAIDEGRISWEEDDESEEEA